MGHLRYCVRNVDELTVRELPDALTIFADIESLAGEEDPMEEVLYEDDPDAESVAPRLDSTKTNR